MNPAAVHLALNNFPPIIDFAALVVFGIGIVWKSHTILRVALALLVLASLIAIPVFLTGEPTEEMVEELEGVNAVAIHPHEEAAEWAAWLLGAQGVAALLALIVYRSRDLPRWAVTIVMILAVVATVAVFRTANLGGRIHHPEAQMAR
ncbi:MAG TPA: hypothetical protein VNA69_16340 [Thermoanaerobaculia bacterium]|nr:hypothetical protein [Thermoanaerobaculia bacterium]